LWGGAHEGCPYETCPPTAIPLDCSRRLVPTPRRRDRRADSRPFGTSHATPFAGNLPTVPNFRVPRDPPGTATSANVTPAHHSGQDPVSLIQRSSGPVPAVLRVGRDASKSRTARGPVTISWRERVAVGADSEQPQSPSGRTRVNVHGAGWPPTHRHRKAETRSVRSDCGTGFRRKPSLTSLLLGWSLTQPYCQKSKHQAVVLGAYCDSRWSAFLARSSDPRNSSSLSPRSCAISQYRIASL